MKDGFRQCMAWLHTWVGLVMGWVLFFMFVTGTTGYFDSEIDRWMRPELPVVTQKSTPPIADSLRLAQRYLEMQASGSPEWGIDLPGTRDSGRLSVWWRDPPKAGQRFGRFHRQALDAQGAPVQEAEVRATGGGQLLYRMHFALHYVPFDWAIRLVGVATMLMLLAIVSGVITHKKIFADFFTFRPAKGQRSWMDAHVLVSVLALPFFAMITYSGLLFFMYTYMPAPLSAGFGTDQVARGQYFDQLNTGARIEAAGRPAPLHALLPLVDRAEAAWGVGKAGAVSVRFPHDANAQVTVRARYPGGRSLRGTSMRFSGVNGEVLTEDTDREGAARATQSVMFTLHEGRYAGALLRWGYFASGLLGCAMVATGLLLWTSKRRARQDKRLRNGQSAEFGFRLVDSLNVGAIAGLCTAIAAYFWANRLIPVHLEGRRDWEVHAMFVVWGLLMLHAALRRRFTGPARVWRDQLGVAAAAWGLLPVLNVLTTERHLGVTLPASDWVLAGFDLTALALGVAFAAATMKVHRRIQRTESSDAGSKHPRLATPSDESDRLLAETT